VKTTRSERHHIASFADCLANGGECLLAELNELLKKKQAGEKI